MDQILLKLFGAIAGVAVTTGVINHLTKNQQPANTDNTEKAKIEPKPKGGEHDNQNSSPAGSVGSGQRSDSGGDPEKTKPVMGEPEKW